MAYGSNYAADLSEAIELTFGTVYGELTEIYDNRFDELSLNQQLRLTEAIERIDALHESLAGQLRKLRKTTTALLASLSESINNEESEE